MKVDILPNSMLPWRFDAHGVTQGFINSFLRCPKQCKLEYVDLWTPKKQSDSIYFGELIHNLLEQFYIEQKPLGEAYIYYLIEEYWQKKGIDLDALEVEQFAKIEEIGIKAEAVFEEYCELYAPIDFQHTWTHTEEIFRVPYQYDPYHMKSWLNGKIDGIYKVGTKYYLMDHKCMSVINLDDIFTILPVDTQVNLYLLASCLQWGECPSGLVYNIIRNPQMKRKEKEKHVDYKQRVKEKIASERSHFFIRETISISEKEIDQWNKTWLSKVMETICQWYNTSYHVPGYFNPQSLVTKYGLAPMAKVICNNDYSDLYQRDVIFPELE